MPAPFSPMNQIASAAARDLGLVPQDATDELEEQQKKRKALLAQQRSMSPFGGAAAALLNPNGNQY